MLLYPNLKLAAGNNAISSMVSIETVTKIAPRAAPVPRPPVEALAQSGKLRRDGALRVTWSWASLQRSLLDTLITTYIGGYNTDYALVTMRTLKRDGTYATYNAILYLPVEVQGSGSSDFGSYRLATTTKVTELQLVFGELVAI